MLGGTRGHFSALGFAIFFPRGITLGRIPFRLVALWLLGNSWVVHPNRLIRFIPGFGGLRFTLHRRQGLIVRFLRRLELLLQRLRRLQRIPKPGHFSLREIGLGLDFRGVPPLQTTIILHLHGKAQVRSHFQRQLFQIELCHRHQVALPGLPSEIHRKTELLLAAIALRDLGDDLGALDAVVIGRPEFHIEHLIRLHREGLGALGQLDHRLLVAFDRDRDRKSRLQIRHRGSQREFKLHTVGQDGFVVIVSRSVSLEVGVLLRLVSALDHPGERQLLIA